MDNKYLYLTINLLITIAGFAFLVQSGFRFDADIFAYPLDDTFIHLSIAKNLALEGVWGITSHEFSSTSSSPLFTIILALLIKVFGNDATIPLYLNAAIASATIVYLNVFSYWSKNDRYFGLSTIIAVLGAILFNLSAMGMEHALQIFTVLLLVDRIFKKGFYLNDAVVGKLSGDWILPVLIILAVSTRFESIFIVAGLCFVLLLGKRYKPIVILSFWAFLPVIVYGIFSISNGSGFVPNSLLMKGHSGSSIFHTLYLHVGSLMKNLYMNGSLFAIFALVLLIQFSFFRGKKENDSEFFKLFIFPLTIGILHHFFAQVNWLFRYENYTLFIAGLCLFPIFRIILSKINWKSYRELILVVVIAILFVGPLLHRNVYALKIHKNAQSDIFYQHISIAEYVSSSNLFDKAPLGINDIGAIAYYADPKLLDIWGLANYELTKFKHLPASEYMPGVIDSLKPVYAIYYKDIFSDHFDGWIDVAIWDTGEKTVAASSKVFFSALDSSHAQKLYSDLEKNRSTFPDKVNFEFVFRRR